MLLFGLTPASPEQREEVLSDTCTLQLLVPAPLTVLVVPAARSVATCPSSLCKVWWPELSSEVFDFAKAAITYLFDCPAGIKHVAERSDNILNHCRLLLCEGMSKVWLIQPGIQNSLIRIPIILRIS